MADFLAQLKALLGGGGGEAPPPAEPDMDEARPWDSPSMRPPPMHTMPGGEMMPGATMPAGPPGSIADDPMALAAKLERQKRIAAMVAPEGAWNR